MLAMIEAKSISEANTRIGGCFLSSFAIFQAGHNAITFRGIHGTPKLFFPIVDS